MSKPSNLKTQAQQLTCRIATVISIPKKIKRTQPSATNQGRWKEHCRHPLRYATLTQAFGASNPNFTKTDHTYPLSIIRQNLLNQRRHSKSHTRKMKTKTKPSRDNNLKTTAMITTATRKLLFPGLASTRRYYYHSTTPVQVHFAFHLFWSSRHHDDDDDNNNNNNNNKRC
jgi:hypothetical protein